MVRYVGRNHCVCVSTCLCVCGWVCVGAFGSDCARGCVFVCGYVSVGPWLCVWVSGSWCEVWDMFVRVCGRVAPTSSHTPTHRCTPACKNKQEVMHPPTCKHNHTPIHKPPQTHTPLTKPHPHKCAHVDCSQRACRVHWGGAPGVRTNEGVHKGEICMNSREVVRSWCEFCTNAREFTPMNRLQACRILTLFVLGAIWAWWKRLGWDIH